MKKELKKEENITEEKTDNEKSKDEVNPIDAILDAKNNDPVTLYSAESDEPIEFEQVALIPLDEKVYVILKPLDDLEDVDEDQGVAFEIIEDDEEFFLNLIEDASLIQKIFDEYLRLSDEQSGDSDKKSN